MANDGQTAEQNCISLNMKVIMQWIFTKLAVNSF